MEKTKIDVTIVVPVYNVENYLANCLESLVSQNYDNDKYEILVINDGSKDKSLDIINDYKLKYDNITLIDLKDNKGVSNARNVGIKKAKGDYIMFCDADDYYDLNALKIFISAAKEKKSDYVVANYVIAKNNKNIKINTTNYFSRNISKKEIVSYMTLTSCSKLIKRDLFIKNDISYPLDLKRCEELTVIPVLAYLANNPIKIDEYLYYYVQRVTSASNKKMELKKMDLSFFDISFERFQKMIDCNKYANEIEFRAIDHLLYGKCLVLLKSHASRKEAISFIDDFRKKYPKYLKNTYFKRFNYLKRIFIYTISFRFILTAKIIAYIHEKLTG